MDETKSYLGQWRNWIDARAKNSPFPLVTGKCKFESCLAYRGEIMKVACIDCVHKFKWRRFCKAETVEYFDPIKGSKFVFRRCVDKNPDGECKDFQPRGVIDEVR
jgi:hypothetical protein